MSSSQPPLDFTSLEGALTSLRRALIRSAGTPMDEELRDACIQRFEYTFELAWKMLKRQMEREAVNTAEIDGYSFKQLFRVAGEKGFIVDVPAWFVRIPGQAGHPFRSKAATDSDASRPPIPRQSGH